MEKKISVVIPNYNGKALLAKNIPAVAKNCPGCEIIVVDDASKDNSEKFIRKNFKEVKLVKIKKNKGFANAANMGIQKATGDLVLLLNSDVSLRSNYLTSLRNKFGSKEVFAVGLADVSHEGPESVIRGRGGAKFSKGFLNHFRLEPKRGETLWVSGGSGIFDREKFLSLGGFDTAFAPFYWEDIDLSFRAWLSGYICLFEPEALVDHYHDEGSIKKNKSQRLIKTSAYKNQFLFVWKNISDPFYLLLHLLWIPYHFVVALLRLDFEFILGFFWALSKIWVEVKDKSSDLAQKKTDREILKLFEK